MRELRMSSVGCTELSFLWRNPFASSTFLARSPLEALFCRELCVPDGRACGVSNCTMGMLWAMNF